jgi:hypothetical protein
LLSLYNYKLTAPSVCCPNLPTAHIIILIAKIITITTKILNIVPVEPKNVTIPPDTFPTIELTLPLS